MRLERLHWHAIGVAAARAQKGVIAAASVLVLPVSLLLFLQWPLREWLHAYSREANDLVIPHMASQSNPSRIGCAER